MNCRNVLFACALIVAGCSPDAERSASPSPPAMAADLGKADDYYRDLYGTPKSETKVAEFDFPLPAHDGLPGGKFRITHPLIVQQFQTDQMQVSVVLSESTRRAIWVKFMLSNSWTQERLNTALAAYGPTWSIVEQDRAMSFLTPSVAPVVYRSSAGALAYKTMSFELMVYSPQLYAGLRTQAEEAKRQKNVAPKF